MKPGPTIRNDADKLGELQRLAVEDSRHPDVKAAADELAVVVTRLGLSGPDGTRLLASLIHTIARDGVRYEIDTKRTGGEDIAGITRPNEHPFAVLRRRDDCDAKARLFVALALAAGLDAEIVPLWRGPELQHVFARVRLGGAWHPVELTLARARIGDEPKAVPFERGAADWRRT